jgi:putative membrane protein
MWSGFVSVVINAVALWMTTVLVSGVSIVPDRQNMLGYSLTLLFVALVFGIVNGTIGRVVRFLAFPLFILTLGLLGLVVNALLFMFVAWLTHFFGFGLQIDGFWSAFWGALVLSIVSGILSFIFRPGKKR